jgi:hypothetical protein
MTPCEIAAAAATQKAQQSDFDGDDLFQYMDSTHLFHKCPVIKSEPAKLHAGCFACTSDEKEDLAAFADVLFFGSMSIDSDLQWDLFPAPLIDRNKQIRSGGVCFLGIQIVEVFMWVLGAISDIMKGKWRTFITDEDFAFTVAIPTFIDEGHTLTHYLCRFHKYRNIKKCINTLLASRAGQLELLKRAGNVCFANNKHDALDAIDEMVEIQPDLQHHLATNGMPSLPLFADSFRGEAHTLGYRATSPAESANAMSRKRLPQNRPLWSRREKP